MAKKFKLISPLQPSECAARLKYAIDQIDLNTVLVGRGSAKLIDPPLEKPDIFVPVAPEVQPGGWYVPRSGGTKAVLGEVKSGSFLVTKRILGTNSFKTFAAGTIEPADNGSVISGEFAVHPEIRKLINAFVWSGILIGGPVAWYLTNQLMNNGMHFRDLLLPSYRSELVAICFFPTGCVIYCLCRAVTVGETDFLEVFLRRTLDAREEQVLVGNEHGSKSI